VINNTLIPSCESVPVAGAPAGQVLNSQGLVKGVGVVVLLPVPDLSTAGAERMT
jgi:hypothetical protein